MARCLTRWAKEAHIYVNLVFVWRKLLLVSLQQSLLFVWERERGDRGATIGAMTATTRKQDKITLVELTDHGRLTAVFSST